jgi:hypothetical protein
MTTKEWCLLVEIDANGLANHPTERDVLRFRQRCELRVIGLGDSDSGSARITRFSPALGH